MSPSLYVQEINTDNTKQQMHSKVMNVQIGVWGKKIVKGNCGIYAGWEIVEDSSGLALDSGKGRGLAISILLLVSSADVIPLTSGLPGCH